MISFAFDQWELHIHTVMHALGGTMEQLLRLIIAGVLGGIVGLEREIRGRQAGFRTYLLVSFGSALVMIVSTQFAFYDWNPPPNVNLNVDPARIAYGVMTGVGFLGAGTIIHNKGTVRGLTTAAGMWCVAGVGLAAGFGLYVLSILATLLIVSALWFLDYVEDGLPKLRYRTVTLRTKYKSGCVADTVAKFKAAKLKVVDASFERVENDFTQADIHFRIAFVNAAQYYQFERRIEQSGEFELISTKEL